MPTLAPVAVIQTDVSDYIKFVVAHGSDWNDGIKLPGMAPLTGWSFQLVVVPYYRATTKLLDIGTGSGNILVYTTDVANDSVQFYLPKAGINTMPVGSWKHMWRGWQGSEYREFSHGDFIVKGRGY